MEILFDLRTITPTKLPLEILQTQVFEKLSVSGRPLALMTILSQSAEALETVLKNRNDLVTGFKSRNERNSAALLPEYLGLPQSRGKIDLNYPDYVKAIFATTDDIIFFSLLLGKDLVEHGDKLAETFGIEFGKKGVPVISRRHAWLQDVSDLIPQESDYSSWIEGFVSATKK